MRGIGEEIDSLYRKCIGCSVQICLFLLVLLVVLCNQVKMRHKFVQSVLESLWSELKQVNDFSSKLIYFSLVLVSLCVSM